MRLTVCIPNFNYAHYIGETIDSVLSQSSGDEIEICIADNQSTDDSVRVIESTKDDRVRLQVNPTNVGFASNLDRVAAMATGDWMLMLSSDDLLRPGAVRAYSKISELIDRNDSVVGASIAVIDAEGERIGKVGGQVWRESDRDQALSDELGLPVYAADPGDLLSRALGTMRNPFRFATTVYPRSMYEAIGGYGHRLYNPDKWFNLRLLERAGRAYFIDAELASYRWHSSNQASQQASSGALKFLVDEYVTSFQVSDEALRRAGLERSDVERAFLHNDIGLRGFRELAWGNRVTARRHVHLAQAAYPQMTRRVPSVMALRVGLAMGPLGTAVARLAQDRVVGAWRRRRGSGGGGVAAAWDHRS